MQTNHTKPASITAEVLITYRHVIIVAALVILAMLWGAA